MEGHHPSVPSTDNSLLESDSEEGVFTRDPGLNYIDEAHEGIRQANSVLLAAAEGPERGPEGGTEEGVSTLVGIDVQLDVELDGEFGGDAGDAGDSSSVPAIPGVGREDSFVLDDDDGNDHELSDELEAAEASAWAEAPALGDAGFEGGDESMMSSDGMTSSVLVTSTYQADEVLGKSDQWAVV